jgi:hypothetical protein
MFLKMLPLVVVLCVPAARVEGSSVVPMNLPTLSDYSGQVVVGEVASVRSYWADKPRRIESEVTFENVEYLKGRLPDASSTFTLVVPGGTVGETSMRVCCAPRFREGEKWALMLLPTYKTFPVAGLWQGAFRIQTDADGVERVHQGALGPVTGVDKEGFVQVRGERIRDPHSHLVESNNVRIKASPTVGAETHKGMAYEDFRSMLRPILAKSKQHRLSEPAGRRILVEYRPVPLKLSPAAEARRRANNESGAAPPVPRRGSDQRVREVQDSERDAAKSEREVQR